MNSKLLSRIGAIFILGGLLAFGLHSQMQLRYQAGKVAFLAEQEARWNRSYTHHPNLIADLFVCTLATALACGVYELISAGFDVLLRKLAPDGAKAG
jgi:hypothetical protein